MWGVRTREDPTRKRTRPPLSTDERDSERGEGVIGGSQDERRPTQPKEPDPHSQPDREGFRKRGEGVIWWSGGLERGTGGQGWLEID